MVVVDDLYERCSQPGARLQGVTKGLSRLILLIDIYLFLQINVHANTMRRNLEYVITDFEVLDGKQKIKRQRFS